MLRLFLVIFTATDKVLVNFQGNLFESSLRFYDWREQILQAFRAYFVIAEIEVDALESTQRLHCYTDRLDGGGTHLTAANVNLQRQQRLIQCGLRH